MRRRKSHPTVMVAPLKSKNGISARLSSSSEGVTGILIPFRVLLVLELGQGRLDGLRARMPFEATFRVSEILSCLCLGAQECCAGPLHRDGSNVTFL